MKCFLSYSGKDEIVAKALHSFLTDAGYEVYFYPASRDIRVFDGMEDALARSSAFIYLNSGSYLKSGYCKNEWQGFLKKASEDPTNVIVGAQLDDKPVPYLLSRWKYVHSEELGTSPATDTLWMSKLVELLEHREPEEEPPGEALIAEIAEEFAERVLSSPWNEDILNWPLLQLSSKDKVREAVIFLKPEGTFNRKCIQRIVCRLLSERINVVQARAYTGECIRRKKLFGKHYLGPMAIAQDAPDFEDDEIEKLNQFYFEKWPDYYGKEETPSPALVIPALLLCKEPHNLSADEVSELWDRGRDPDLFWNGKPNGLNKVGYQKSIMPVQDPRICGGKPRLILNGYVLGYQKLLERPPDEVRVLCLRVRTDRDWDEIRDDVIGGDSNPANCKRSSLRYEAFCDQESFGIPREFPINGQKNLLHASATPLEGIYEISLWFDTSLDDTYLGAHLARKLGEEQLQTLFFDFPELLRRARDKDLSLLIQEALDSIPPPGVSGRLGKQSFGDFSDKALHRFEELFVKSFKHRPDDLNAGLDATPAIRHLINLGFAVHKYGHKAMVEKFASSFDNDFFREKSRQFANMLVYAHPHELDFEPELVGLAIRIVCSDLLILSHSVYPDDFVAGFLDNLHDRARDIARRTRSNALKQCAVNFQHPPEGNVLKDLPDFAKLREANDCGIRVDVGNGTPSVIALVMAGGRSTRVQSIIPKPIIRLDSRFLVDHVVDNIATAMNADDKMMFFLSIGWESDLVKACLGGRFRYLSLPKDDSSTTSGESSDKGGQPGFGPGARLYAALLQLSSYTGPILACYSDMPMVSPGALRRLYRTFADEAYDICFLTADNAPLHGYVIRDSRGQVKRIAHWRNEMIPADATERDAGFYMFCNTRQIRDALGQIRNANVKQEYGIHQLVEQLALRDLRIGTVKIPAKECLTVNNAADLFWLALGLNENDPSPQSTAGSYDSFTSDYGVTFDYDLFLAQRGMLRAALDPTNMARRQVPLHFLTESDQ